MSSYDSLNREQKEACFRTEGPVLILAGAGSGKTRVITSRIAYLIEECGVNPWNILAITFTNKAAGEMRERVDRMVGYGSESIWVSTFHSMCVRILRRHIDQLGYDTGFSIYDTDDQKTLMKGILKSLRIDPKELKEKTVLGEISSAKNELISPLRYKETHTFSFQEKQIGEAYEAYQRELHRNNALDFDDLLVKTVELFRSHPEILENYQERFRYIMVDEYQDTNTAQFELVRLLAEKYRNLCVVGDDDQSIYRFRGANIRNILDFEQVFRDCYVVKLEQNYRSTQNVLDAANAVIRNNVNRKQKALWTDRGEGNKIHFRQFDSAMEEASFIAEDVGRAMRQDRDLKYSDFAVLYRTNAQARLLEERFIMASVPYNVVGGTNFYSRKEVKDILCYLKTVDNGTDDLAVRRIINVPRRGIGDTTIGKLEQFASENDLCLMEAIERSSEVTGISRASQGKILPFAELIGEFRNYLSENASDPGLVSGLLRKIIERTDYIEELRNSEEEDAEDRIANIDELITKAVTYEESLEEELPTLTGFLEEIALVADLDSTDENDDRVLLMTLHSAKGLEFTRVYLAGAEDGIFPSQMTIDSDSEEDMEEERRLAYVGITRARDDITITCARSRMIRGETHFNPVSRFIFEIPEELLDEKPGRKKSGSFDFSDRYQDRTDRYRDRTDRYQERFYDEDRDFRGSGGRTFVTYAGAGKNDSGSAFREEKAALPAGRPRAVKKDRAEEHRPFIAKASASYAKLSSLQKGSSGVQSIDYGVGDAVAHVKFGKGIVKAVESTPKDFKVTVDFEDYGTKVMYAAFAKLEKL